MVFYCLKFNLILFDWLINIPTFATQIIKPMETKKNSFLYPNYDFDNKV